MKLIVCSLYDVKAERFLRPIFSPTLGVIYRDLGDEMSKQAGSNSLVDHAEDFNLYQLGTFDDDTGRFEALAQPHLVTNVAALRVSPAGNQAITDILPVGRHGSRGNGTTPPEGAVRDYNGDQLPLT